MTCRRSHSLVVDRRSELAGRNLECGRDGQIRTADLSLRSTRDPFQGFSQFHPVSWFFNNLGSLLSLSRPTLEGSTECVLDTVLIRLSAPVENSPKGPIQNWLFRNFDAAHGAGPATAICEYGNTRARRSSKPARPYI